MVTVAVSGVTNRQSGHRFGFTARCEWESGSQGP